MYNRCRSTPLSHKQACLRLLHRRLRVRRRYTATSGSTREFVHLPSLDANISTRCLWTRQLSSLWVSIMAFQLGTNALKLSKFGQNRSHRTLPRPPSVLLAHGAVRMQFLRPQQGHLYAVVYRLLLVSGLKVGCSRTLITDALHIAVSPQYGTTSFGPIAPPMPHMPASQPFRSSNNPFSLLSTDMKADDDDEDNSFIWRGRGH